MRRGMTAMVFGAALMMVGGAAQAAPILVNFQKVASGQQKLGSDWYNKFGAASDNELTIADRALVDSASGTTGISMSSPNFGGFLNDDRGNGIDFSFNGFTFAGTAMNSYVAENYAVPRDGLTVLRFTSDTQYTFNFTIAASFHNSTDGDPPAASIADGANLVSYNIGGTFTGGTTRAFSGGTTVQIDASATDRDRAGAIISGKSIFDSGLNKYVLDLQMGSNTAGGVATINALKLDLAAVPEPGTLSLLAVGSLALLRRRRRMA